MYRPLSANVSYYESMLDQIEAVRSYNNKMILMGDLNFDYKYDTDLSKIRL